MNVYCDQCGKQLDPRMDRCPQCGAPNRYYQPATPQTIDELKQFAQIQGLPLDKMRVFLGIDTKEARAFGIYQDTNGLFVVYKNKADGTRAVRYNGPDEAHAVNELYQKMLAEMQTQRENGTARPKTVAVMPDAASAPKKKKKGIRPWHIVLIVIAALILFLCLRSCLKDADMPNEGYYLIDDMYYYCYDGYWYYYDDTDDDWYYYSDGFSDYDDYYLGDDYDSSYDTEDWDDYYYYDDTYTDDSDSSWWDSDDDDSSWWSSDSSDYSSWDSGGTDWDSDWR